MSEYEPITSKLRWLIDGSPHGQGPAQFGGHPYVEVKEEDAIRLCDEIDAVHRNLEEINATLRDSRRWIQLPEDEDGECIHIGDKLVDDDGTAFTVSALRMHQFGWEIRGVDGTDRAVYTYPDTCCHAPTPESILREYTEKICGLCSNEYDSNEARDELLRQYTEKLTKCLES